MKNETKRTGWRSAMRLCAASLALAAGGTAWADFYWTAGGSGTDWNTTANWSGTLDNTANYVFGGLESSNWVKGKDITVTFADAYTATPAAGIWVENVDSGNGSLTWTADTDEHGLALTGGMTIGTATSGKLHITKGTFTISNYLDLGIGNGASSYLTIDGALVTVNGLAYLSRCGWNNNETYYGELNIVNGGQLVVDGIDSEGWGMYVGGGDNAEATINVANGTLSIPNGDLLFLGNGTNNDTDDDFIINIENGGTLSIGTESSPKTLATARWGDEPIAVNIASGGLLKTGRITRGETDGQPTTITFNGGEIQVLGDFNDGNPFIQSAGINVVVGSAGGTIDTNGKAITIAAPVTGTGTLIITGGGSVTFTKKPTCSVFVDNDGTTATVNETVLDLTFDNSDYADGWSFSGTGNEHDQKARPDVAGNFLYLNVPSSSGYRESIAKHDITFNNANSFVVEMDWYAKVCYHDSTPYLRLTKSGVPLFSIECPNTKWGQSSTGYVYGYQNADSLTSFTVGLRTADCTTDSTYWYKVKVEGNANGVTLAITKQDGTLVWSGKVSDSYLLPDKIDCRICATQAGSSGGIDNIVAVDRSAMAVRKAAVVTASGTTCYASVADAIAAAATLGAANYDYIEVYENYELPVTAANSGVKVKQMGSAVVTSTLSGDGVNDTEYQVSTSTDAGVTTYTLANKPCTYTWAGTEAANWSVAGNWTYGESVTATRAPTTGDSVVIGANSSVTLDSKVGSVASITAADDTAVIINNTYNNAENLTTALQDSETWKGTYRICFNIPDKATCSEFSYFNYGNANSTIEFNGNLTIFRLKYGTFYGTVKIVGTLTVPESYGGGQTSTISKLMGNGTWKYTKSGYYQRIIVQDASGFSGSLDAQNDNSFSVSSSSTYNTGTIWIANDTAVLGSGATWKGSKGVKIGASTVTVKGNSNLTVTGTESGNAIYILSGATFKYDAVGMVTFSSQPVFCTAVTTGDSTAATSESKATVYVAIGEGVTLANDTQLMAWTGTAPDNVTFEFADSSVKANWVLEATATGLYVRSPAAVVDNVAYGSVAEALTHTTTGSKIVLAQNSADAITLSGKQTLTVNSGVNYTGALTVNSGVAVLPCGASPSAITIGANGVVAFDMTGQTITKDSEYTLATTTLSIPNGEKLGDSIFTIGPDFESALSYDSGVLKATATSASTGKTRVITMFLSTGLYIDNNTDAWSNGVPNGHVFGTANYDETRNDIAVFPATATMYAWAGNVPQNFIAVVRGGTLTLASGSTQTTLAITRLVSTGTVVCDNFSLVAAGETDSIGALQATSGGSLTIPSGKTTSVTLDSTSSLKLSVEATPDVADALLTASGDLTSANVTAPGYLIRATYDSTENTTVWKAYARDGYVPAWTDTFSVASTITANFSMGTVNNAIFNTTAGEGSGSPSSYIKQSTRTVDGDEVQYADITVSSGTVDMLYSLSTDYATETEQVLEFDWFAGSGYYSKGAASNGVAIVATDGTTLATIMSPHSSENGKTATATIYKGDDSESVLGTLTSAARNYGTSYSAYWYRVTVTTSSSGVTLAIKNIESDADVTLSSNVLSDTPCAVGKIAFHEVRKNVSNYTGLANVSINLLDYLDKPAQPVIMADDGTGKEVRTITITAEEGMTIFYWTSADSTIQTYTEPFELPNSATVYAYAKNSSGTKSLNSSEYVYSNLGAINLVTPTVCRRGLNRLYITSDNSGVTGQPTPVYKYQIGEDVVTLAAGATQLPYIEDLASKTVKVWATHELYANSAEVTWIAPVSVSAEDYAVAYTMDYVETFIANSTATAWVTDENSGKITKTHIVVDVESTAYGDNTYYALSGGGISLYDPIWYAYSTYNTSGSPRWEKGDYGLAQVNIRNASLIFPDILFAEMKSGDKIYVNANDAPQNYGNLTQTASGNGEYVYTVNSDGDCRIGFRRYVGTNNGSSGTTVNIHVIRIYKSAAAKVNGVGYLTVDEAVSAAAGTGASVEVVDASTLSSADIELKPGVSLTGLGETAVGEVTIKTIINENEVDMTSYYTAASLEVVNGAISPELDEAVAPVVDTTSEEPMTVEAGEVTFAVDTTSLKTGLYYGVGTRSTPDGAVKYGTMMLYDGTNANAIDFTADLPDSGVLYYTIEASDTDLTP